MSFTPILTYSQQIAIKKISANNQSRYAAIELEVENSELRELLGTPLLQDLQQNASTALNVKLLDGTSFNNCAGNAIYHKGLRYVLAYLVYSRYISESLVSDTFTGFVQKTRQDSELLSDGRIRQLQEFSRKVAMSEWLTIKEYLNINSTDYPLWISTETKKPYTPRFYAIRKTKSSSENDLNINYIQM
jgi:hypothetical protein